MRGVSFRVLDHELRRATYSALLLMAFIFLVGVSFILHSHNKKQSAHMREDFSQMIGTQQGYVAQEIYMNRDQALGMRLDSILSTWKEKYPEVQACIRIVFDPSDLQKNTISRCSIASEIDWKEPHGESIISAGNNPIARLQYIISSPFGWKDLFPPALILAILFAFISASVLHWVLMRRLQKRVLQPLVDTMAQGERNAAIAETTQMIAHDVRKPFWKLKMALQTLQFANDKNSFQKLCVGLLPGIEASAQSVEAMLQELIETGTTSLAKEEIPPARLVEGALQDLFEHNSQADIRLSCEFKHTHLVKVEKERLFRVLLNVFENACHAMRGKGKIWIATRDQSEKGEDFVVFTVGNSGPVIPRSDLDRIFESFFTRKKKGHGLGLAIAERIVTSHGGRIWCESTEAHGTEFSFAIPAIETEDDYYPRLPSHSGEIAKNAGLHASAREKAEPTEPAILVFEDDVLVRDCWEDAAKKQNLRIHQFKSWEDFVARDGFHLIANGTAFIDIKFTGSRYDGYHIALQLRKLGINRLHAITGLAESEVKKPVFDSILGKDVPMDIRALVA